MNIQKKDWGTIEWLEKTGPEGDPRELNTGIVTLSVGEHQHRHLHYDEQVIYGMQGKAVSYLDGEREVITPGKVYHWPAGVIHEIYNVGNIPFQHLLVSNPTQDEIRSVKEISENGQQQDMTQLTNLLYVAVDAIYKQYLERLQYAYTIYDWVGNLILQGSHLPTYCLKHCNRNEPGKICPCMVPRDMDRYREDDVLFCPHGLEIFNVPIHHEGQFVGYVQGGYIYQSQKLGRRLRDVYDTPDSAAAGIHNLLKKIVKSIEDYSEFEALRQDLLSKESQIHDSRTAQRELVENLRDAEYEMTDLRINNHFLFNTLNGMASMALEGGQTSLYQSIVDLSKMFHYTLRTQNNIVPLTKELEYVKAYLQLQQLRYGEGLQVCYDAETQLQNIPVPFNFLQPLVENIFVHGFTEEKEKRIRLSIQKEEGWLHIEICNTGLVLDELKCEKIRQQIQNSSTHGMAMIYHKLWAVYGTEMYFDFLPWSEGMRIVMKLPCEISGTRNYDREGEAQL